MITIIIHHHHSLSTKTEDDIDGGTADYEVVSYKQETLKH